MDQAFRYFRHHALCKAAVYLLIIIPCEARKVNQHPEYAPCIRQNHCMKNRLRPEYYEILNSK